MNMAFNNPAQGGYVTYEYPEIIRRAESGNYPPTDNPLQATSFSSWVFNLCHAHSKSQKELYAETFIKGKMREFEISRLTKHLTLQNHKSIPTDWLPVYEDPLVQDARQEYFVTKNLKINGEELHCRPDVVLFNDLTKELLIVERKSAITSEASIPDHFYPNVLAQLWCYSKIDFEQANWPIPKKVILAAELWYRGKNESEFDGRYKCHHWVMNNADTKNKLKPIEALFAIYSAYYTKKFSQKH
jgi:hypothetical protein